MKMYWSDRLKYLPIADVTSRNRFSLLMKYLHFANNSDNNNGPKDKCFEVRPLLTHLQTNLKNLPESEHYTVDEQNTQ